MKLMISCCDSRSSSLETDDRDDDDDDDAPAASTLKKRDFFQCGHPGEATIARRRIPTRLELFRRLIFTFRPT